MSSIIPYGKQHITEEDVASVVEVLKSNYLTQGPKISEFEKAFSDYIGCNYAVAVSNGTAALHLSILALGIQPGDRVITSPITFSATANAIRYCDGEVVFSDINSDSYLLDFDKVKALIESKPKGYFKGIMPIDFAGRAIDMEAFKKLADKHKLWILEDSCHAPGGYFIDSKNKNQNCGNGNFANASIFSFHPVKHIACGEGGMITTNDKKVHDKLLKLRTHGITKDSTFFENSIEQAGGTDKYPGWYMEMQDLGYNYRLTDIQAALGISQLKRANQGLKKRREIATRYFKAFENKKFIKSQSGALEGHAYHLYIIEVEDRLDLYNFLKSKNIFTQIHYIPVHLMPYYRGLGWKEGDFLNAEAYYKQCISLPIYPELSEKDQSKIIGLIKEFYGK